jgi:hypothetical protein
MATPRNQILTPLAGVATVQRQGAARPRDYLGESELSFRLLL